MSIISVCKRGNCVDYCNLENVNLEPGEQYEENCTLIKCLEDFKFTQEGCGIANFQNCTLRPDFSVKYPGRSKKTFKNISFDTF